MRTPSLSCLLVSLLVLGAWPGPSPAHEIDDLRKELGEIKRELGEIKRLLETALRPARQAGRTASVSVTGKPSLGRPDAPLTMVEFSDYQCPFCKRHFETVYPVLKREYVDTGKVRYVFHGFPIDRLHPRAARMHEAAHCAGEQHRYWEMHDRLFANSKDPSVAALERHAQDVGIDAMPFSACLASGKYTRTVQEEIAEGGKVGVRGTPTFVIGPSTAGTTTGVVVTGAQPLSVFQQVIEQMLKAASSVSPAPAREGRER
ncbi:MAG: DsbA family protein [Candidatus Rokuibacteriota bacterium]